jgi:hypothetical protein
LNRSFNQIGKVKIGRDIFFLHIPKCGGTSLVNSIRQFYYTLDPKDDRKIGHLHPGAALRAANLLEQDPLAYNRDISHYFLGQNYRFVSGHFAFSNKAFDEFENKYSFITLLRDPVKKWFSLYFFNRYKEGEEYSLELELEDFLKTEMAAGYGCDYAMQFAGDDTIKNFTTSGAIHSFTSDGAVDRAIENLKKFHLVGTLESLPEFIREFELMFKVKLVVERKRKSPVATEFQNKIITPEILARVEELNKPNLAIYSYVTDELINTYSKKTG